MKKIKNTCAFRLWRLIARHSILPATLHKKKRVRLIERSFNSFWGLNALPIHIEKTPSFSTFGFSAATCLWTHYFNSLEAITALREAYKPCPFQIASSSGVTLCGMHYKKCHPTWGQKKRIFIIFNGNGEIFRIGAASWLFKILLEVSCDYDVVMFDPRECGNSSGIANAKGLIEDGETIYQFVHTTLKFSEDQIDLYGFSLGGAIATLVKALHPTTAGMLISNRSFESLDQAVIGLFQFLWRPLAHLAVKIAFFITRQAEWHLDPFESMKHITSPRLIICHEKDPIVRHSASMLNALINHDIHHECHIAYLHQKDPHQKVRNHHVQPLDDYVDQNNTPALNIVKNFISLHLG